MLQASLLFRILRATHANGTHHKLALDALPNLRCANAEAWRQVFLKHAKTYLEGSKAPDKEFKDFTNHVLHVRDGYWGGAAEKAMHWYGHTVEALQDRNWQQAVYAAGVMSHYYTDPIMPFHTAQSEAENNIHRAAEWSISKSYDDLNRLAQTDFPKPDVPIEDREDWLADLVCDAAEISNTFYEKLIANYDIDRGVVDPPAGLNERARRMTAQLIAYAQVGQARILDRAIAEAGVEPPEVTLTAETVIASLEIPIKWVLRKLADAEDRAVVTAMYDELQATGTVERNLPADDKAVRTAFQEQVGIASPEPRPAFRPVHKQGAFDYGAALEARAARELLAAAAIDDKAVKTQTEAPSPAATAVTPPEATDTANTPRTSRKERRKTRKERDAQAATSPQATAAGPTSTPAQETEPDAGDKTPPPAAQDDSADSRDPVDQLRARAAEMQMADGVGAHADCRLRLDDEVEDGPSVGPKTAIRLNKIGIVSVADLLAADPAATAAALDVHYIEAATITDWQDQARLQCSVPSLSGTAAQLLVGSGVRSAAQLAGMSAPALATTVAEFASGAEGARLLRDRAAPDAGQIAKWIANAAFAPAGLASSASKAA